MCCFRASLHSLSGCMKHNHINHNTYPRILGLHKFFWLWPARLCAEPQSWHAVSDPILAAPPSHWWFVPLFSLTPPPYLAVWFAPAKNHPGRLKTSSKLWHLDSQQSPFPFFFKLKPFGPTIVQHLQLLSSSGFLTINSNQGVHRCSTRPLWPAPRQHPSLPSCFPAPVFDSVLFCGIKPNRVKLWEIDLSGKIQNFMESLDVWLWFMSLYLGMLFSSSDRVKSFSLASSSFRSSCWCFSATYHQLTSKTSKQATQRTLGLHLHWK